MVHFPGVKSFTQRFAVFLNQNKQFYYEMKCKIHVGLQNRFEEFSQ